MTHGVLTEKPMGRPKSNVPKPHTVRITAEAQEVAGRAAALARMSVPDWVSMAIVAQGNLEIDRFVTERQSEKKKG